MPIQTATPEQVEQCVLGLKRTVDSQAATIERLQFDYAEAMRQYNAQQKRACDAEAEIERLREAYNALCDSLELYELPDVAGSHYRRVRAALDADHDAR